MSTLDALSHRELSTWLTLIFDITITVYYFICVINLPDGVGLYSLEMGAIIIRIITYSIVASIGICIILSIIKKEEEEKDERDYQIEARANSLAYYVLLVAIAILIGFVATNGTEFNSSVFGHFQITSMLMANLLLLTMFAATATKALAQLYGYRKGY